MEHGLQVKILKELMQQLDEGKNIDIGKQYRMPVNSYVSQERAAKEQEHFFKNHPQLIGLSQDLPEVGSFMTINDFGVPVLATRAKGGKFRAFLNACRHRSVKVTEEERGKKTVFMCPFHHWSYANSGELLNIPDNDHFGEIDKSCHGLVELPAAEQGGLLWVNPNPEGSLDLDDLLGPLKDELASFGMDRHLFGGITTIEKRLNWKLANDTFGETYHFAKLHKDTLGRIFYGNNLHFEEFGRHHRFVTASRGIDAMRVLPESEWDIGRGTFVLYHLFPNIQLIVNDHTTTLIRIYPEFDNPSKSVTKINFYFSAEAAAYAEQRDAEVSEDEDVYDFEGRAAAGTDGPSLAASIEIFRSTVETEDYEMGEMQQRAAESGMLKEVVFGRNEPALHHFHRNYSEALGEAAPEPIT